MKLATPYGPTETTVAAAKPVPWIVMLVPPSPGPLAGETEVTVGTGGRYVNRSSARGALVPFAVVTVMSTIPAPAGDRAVIELSSTTV